jgi:hypothetical protein
MSSLLAVLDLAVPACDSGSVSGSVEPEASRVESVSGEESVLGEESDNGPDEVACGRPFELPAAGGLRLVAQFPEHVAAGQPTLSGTVEVTSEEGVRGVAAAAADVFLVRDGRVVTTPLAQDAIGIRCDLAAGETASLAGLALLTSCEPDGGPVPPDVYELYVRVVLIPDDEITPQAFFGGPWPLRVE